jgi:hypothetical protein
MRKRPLKSMRAYQLFRAKRDDTTSALEMVQRIIILSFVIVNSKGVWMGYRSLNSTAMLLSRQMSLHGLEQVPRVAATNAVQLETSRRVWRCLVTTDWYVYLRCLFLAGDMMLTIRYRLLAARYGRASEGV